MPAKVSMRQSSPVRQRQIIEAARSLIVKYGSEHLTVRRIAKEVEISEAAIYRHFRNKRQILAYLIDYIKESWVNEIEDGFASGDRSTLEILESVLRSHFSAISQRRGISFQVIAEIISFGDKRLNKKALDAISEYVKRVKQLLSQAAEAGEIKKDVDLDAAANLLFGMVQGLVNVWALSGYDFDLEQRYTEQWRLLRQVLVKS